MKNKKILILILIILLGAVVFYIKYEALSPSVDHIETPTKEEVIVCAQDVRQCRNGTYVQRVTPKCDFQKCQDGSIPPTDKPVFEDGTVPQE